MDGLAPAYREAEVKDDIEELGSDPDALQRRMSAEHAESTDLSILDAHSVTRIDGCSFTGQWAVKGGQQEPWPQGVSVKSGGLSPREGAEPSDIKGLSKGAVARVMVAVRGMALDVGFDALTLDAVVLAANLDTASSAAFRAHFKDESALIETFVGHMTAPLYGGLTQAIIAGGSVLDGLEAAGRRWVTHVRQNAAIYWLLMNAPPSSAGPHARLVYRRWHQLMRQQRTIVSGILAEGQIRGEIREGDAMVLSAVVGGSMRGLLHMLSDPVQLISSGIYAQDLVERTFEVLKAGLKPEGAQGESM